MGISQEFYTGNADAIGTAFGQLDFDALEALRTAYADFSLHLSPTDLDILSEKIAEQVKRPPVLLLDSLERSLADLGDDGAADVVAKAWVEMVADLPERDCKSVAAAWIQSVGDELGEQLELTDDAVLAVQNLVSLCRQAKEQSLDVVYTWYP